MLLAAGGADVATHSDAQRGANLRRSAKRGGNPTARLLGVRLSVGLEITVFTRCVEARSSYQETC